MSEITPDARRDHDLLAAVITVTVLLMTIPLMYTALGYLISAHAPELATACFELSLAASTMIAWPLAALMIALGVGLWRSRGT